MENSIDYVNHVNIVKELNQYTTIRENQRPHEKAFEEIYAKAKEADVKVETAKEFLNDLSRTELRTLQKFEGLAESIDLDKLTNEGAYNLLVHTYEKYDWNNDGTTEIGEARVLMSIPKNMDDTTKKAWVKTLNSMGDDWMAIGVITMSLNDEYNKRQIAEHLSQMSESERAKMQETSSFDINKFIQETLSKPYNPKMITFQDILDKVNGVIDGSDGSKSSAEMIQSAQHLKEELLKAYKEVEAENQGVLTTQKGIDIKQESNETMKKEKQSGLEIALKETRTPEEIKAQY